MFALIGQTLKYGALVILVLILSHIIQIRGTTISQHVENTMDWVAGIKPKREITKVTQELSSSVNNVIRLRTANTRAERGTSASADTDISAGDQRQLNHLIQKTQR
ncbi:MAG: hypothetical protein JST80_10480 [Bdellovibrionales bacterium]|nr:hypothetical protein [Bdellovibrionales bacterium]